MGALKTQDVKMTDQVEGHEIATETKITKQKFSLNCKLNFHNVIHQSETAQFTKENIVRIPSPYPDMDS